MQITIEYASSWRNSFLDGSNNESLPKNGRNFIASMTTLKTVGNFKNCSVTKDTVMGILNRLIGDQRKLYQARQDPNYYFKDIEQILRDEDIQDRNECINHEMVYLRNMSGSTDQNAFTGMIKAQDPIFQSDYSSRLWGILWLDLDQTIAFILDENYHVICNHLDLDPLTVIQQLEALNSTKAVDVSDRIEQCLDVFKKNFPDVDYKLTAKGQLTPITLYTSALYLQLLHLGKQYDLTDVLTKSGGLSGISKRGFTKKDFMDRYTTGKKKLIWGNPYLWVERKKGEGEIHHSLTKTDGVLTIHLDISEERAKDLKQKIDDAAVSSFYLGKKGLAYVTEIETRKKR
ncbi:type I-Fv CRISPR-associated protein Cas5fv [Gallibacterium salpingitidis]|uniref:Cas5fv helical domain-containing protein n=1 Tax=Gallibacterium salpingitidis TaxID=505341 RepID=A0A1A7NVE5_9PAST|nr:type I-Fv CRISPR-associated protein Cas5fv [Gallibacterium salpingitidis]OBW93550.1 hypothetical protein QS62_07265 [Gallibacterium salpingitidis]